MKVIDLLNKIANREQPSHIRMYGRDWFWNNYDGYVTEGSLSATPDAQFYLFSQYRLDFALDKEVEIIEEKDIEELIKLNNVSGSSDLIALSQMQWENNSLIERKINELVKAVNELREGK